MEKSLSNLVNKLSEAIHKVKYRYEHDNNNVKRVKLHTKIVIVVLNTKTLKSI